MSKLRFFSTVSLFVLLVGCAGFQHDHVQIDQPFGCPKQTAASLASEQNQLDSLSDTHTLACALTVLHDTQNQAVRRTSLGSRLSLNLAERETHPNKRKKLATVGVDFAEDALAHGGSSDGAVHYYLAANLGLAVREHPTQAMGSLGRLEDEMKKAVALSPDIDDGGPLRLLGTLYLKAPAWPNGIGDRDKALELLEKAVKEHPAHPLNHLFYAQALWDDGDEANLNQVKAEFALGKKLLNKGNWGYSKEPWKKEFDEFQQEFGDSNGVDS